MSVRIQRVSPFYRTSQLAVSALVRRSGQRRRLAEIMGDPMFERGAHEPCHFHHVEDELRAPRCWCL